MPEGTGPRPLKLDLETDEERRITELVATPVFLGGLALGGALMWKGWVLTGLEVMIVGGMGGLVAVFASRRSLADCYYLLDGEAGLLLHHRKILGRVRVETVASFAEIRSVGIRARKSSWSHRSKRPNRWGYGYWLALQITGRSWVPVSDVHNLEAAQDYPPPPPPGLLVHKLETVAKILGKTPEELVEERSQAAGTAPGQ